MNKTLMRDLRTQALYDQSEVPPDPIVAKDIVEAVYKFKKDTALGCDQWDIAMLRSLSKVAYDRIADLINMVERSVAWPIQVLLNIIVLMGKLKGGVHPIALMPMIYRTWTKVRKCSITLWEDTHGGVRDATIKGSSAHKSCGPWHSLRRAKLGRRMPYRQRPRRP